MKYIKYVTVYLLWSTLALGASLATERQTEAQTAETVIKKCLDKLNSLQEIRYSYYRSINYFSKNYYSVSSCNTFIDFRATDNLVGLNFQFDNETYKIIFNGTDYFELDKTNKTKELIRNPKVDKFQSLSFLYNSVVTLKNTLPKIAADTAIKKSLGDTTINNTSYYLLSLLQKEKAWTLLGDFAPNTEKIDFSYRIIIDKESDLPIEVIQSNSVDPKDYVSSRFTYDLSDQEKPTEHSWYYSSYSDYSETDRQHLTLIKDGSLAPSWNLPLFGTASHVSSAQLNGQYVLLEFWMKNCSNCIAAVPSLNKLTEQYKGRGLTVIGVNPVDRKADIAFFYEKYLPQYQTLIDNGAELAHKFGIYGYPQIILIDDNNKVVYTGDIDHDRIATIMEKSVQK